MRVRDILLQLHLWTGLSLGVLFIILGLSGSAIVYPTLLAPADTPARPSSADRQASLEQQIAAARQVNPSFARQTANLSLPDGDGTTAITFASGRDGAGGRGREGRRNRPQLQVFVDPGTAAVVGTRTTAPSRMVRFAHQLHESLFLGPMGRSIVGCLGIAMTLLGISGLYLWWPRSHQWKQAFFIRGKARGAALYRDIHKTFGFWFLPVFLVVSVTGVAIAFPNLLSSGRADGDRGDGGRARGFSRDQATIQIPDQASRLSLHDIIADAEHAFGAKAARIAVAAEPDRPVTVGLAFSDGRSRDVQMNPYTGEALNDQADRQRPPNMRSLHEGQGLGPVYRAAVFVVGFLPLLFAVSGLLLWLKKRKAVSSTRGEPVLTARAPRSGQSARC